MKKRTAFFGALFAVSSIVFSYEKVNAEDYFCSYELSNLGQEDEYEQRTYKRSGKTFNVNYDNTNYEFQILRETKKFIILTNSDANSHPEVLVALIDKKNKEIYENYLTIKDRGEPAYPTFGKCVLYK
tara:strand:+ start:258 stop:641 length:384 start_codon:yes stop_codon:yes gene_type:complete